MNNKNLKSLNGWIDKYGKFYPCETGEHSTIFPNHKIEYDTIKITTYLKGRIFCNFEPTQAQINTIYEWCEINDKMNMWEYFKMLHLDA